MHIRRQPVASIPDGPADPSVRSAALRMVCWCSNSTGWSRGLPAKASSTRASGCAGAGDCGCLSFRISNTRCCSPLISTCVDSESTPPDWGVWESTLRAQRMFPRSINFVKPRRVPSYFLAVTFRWLLFRRCSWMARQSSISTSTFPDFQAAGLRLRHVTWSLVLDSLWGFWSRSRGMVITAVKANDSSCEPSA